MIRDGGSLRSPPSAFGLWLGAAAGALGAALAAPHQPVAAAAALAAGGLCLWSAWASRSLPAPAPLLRPEPPPPPLHELTPLLEALPDAALLIDNQGRVAGSNRAARERLAFEAAGLRLSSILRQPDLLDAVQAALHGETRTIEFETAAPVEEHVRAYVAPIVSATAAAALIVFHDETARIASEQMRADFLANASHELRTPLSAVMILLDTLAGPARDDPEAMARFLALMRSQADRMKRLIDDLLSLSRIEMDEHVPPADRADLAEVVREAVDALSGVAAERGVRLDVASAPALVIGERFQLVQVVQNLLDNAIKYSEPGGVVRVELGVCPSREEAVERAGRRWEGAGRISLLTPVPAPGKAYAYVRVEDSGRGVARHFLPRLGARFFRVEREEGQDRGGTGLGLAIVKHIVNRHRGGVVVESEPGRGSAFAAYVESAP